LLSPAAPRASHQGVHKGKRDAGSPPTGISAVGGVTPIARLRDAHHAVVSDDHPDAPGVRPVGRQTATPIAPVSRYGSSDFGIRHLACFGTRKPPRCLLT
jgi:hypothetical protein